MTRTASSLSRGGRGAGTPSMRTRQRETRSGRRDCCSRTLASGGDSVAGSCRGCSGDGGVLEAWGAMILVPLSVDYGFLIPNRWRLELFGWRWWRYKRVSVSGRGSCVVG